MRAYASSLALLAATVEAIIAVALIVGFARKPICIIEMNYKLRALDPQHVVAFQAGDISSQPRLQGWVMGSVLRPECLLSADGGERRRRVRWIGTRTTGWDCRVTPMMFEKLGAEALRGPTRKVWSLFPVGGTVGL